MAINLNRLPADLKQLKTVRAGKPIGRPKTGATEVIRQQYFEIVRMHDDDGYRWTEIAVALAAQGVTQGPGSPITGRRLTALMRNVARQIEKAHMRNASRSKRCDLGLPS